MFLIINEDGEITKTEKITAEDLYSCDMGVISIIDISGNQPVTYFEESWIGIDNWGE